MSVEGDRSHHRGLAGGPPPTGGSHRPYILTINGGSSSLKFAVFDAAGPLERAFSGCVERVGHAESRLIVRDAGGGRCEDRAVEARDQATAAGLVIEQVVTRV